MSAIDYFAVGLALVVAVTFGIVYALALRDMRRDVKRMEHRFLRQDC